MTTTMTKTQTRTNTQTQTGLDSISKGSLAAMGGISALIGVWAAACFIGATISGGPFELVKNFFQAITGM